MADHADAMCCPRPPSKTSLAPVRLQDKSAAVAALRTEEMFVVSVSYPGKSASVPAARRFVRDAFAGSPRVDDLELIAAELATNAIKHTSSGADDGTYTMTVMAMPGGARIEVADLGRGYGDASTQVGALSEYGRGLQIVSVFADKCGHDMTTGQLHLAWAELYWLPRPGRRSPTLGPAPMQRSGS